VSDQFIPLDTVLTTQYQTVTDR